MNAALRLRGLGVRFQFDRQKRPATPIAARLRGHVTTSWGLRDVSIDAGAGESLALIGPNGAGKTTVLRAIAGVLPADRGTVEVQGRVGPLLSVEAGLVAQLTGRENARLLAVLVGIRRRESEAALAEIRRLSGLEESFELPVASYSEGMRARLGFAAAEQSLPDILLLDEVHEALDHEFRETVASRARATVQSGGIVVAAGQDVALLERLCERAVLLEDGCVKADGPIGEVAPRYLGSVR